MSLETLLLFIPACFALNMAPGPNNLLSVSNATRYGFWIAIFAGIGRLIAFILMISIAAMGLATVLQAMPKLFYVIKFADAVYLLYIAFQLWRLRPMVQRSINLDHDKQCLMILGLQEFFVAMGNPKALLIFTAFLPQFIDLSQSSGVQFFILGLLFLFLEWIAIAVYAYIGTHIQTKFKALMGQAGQMMFNRICALLLGAAGIALLLA